MYGDLLFELDHQCVFEVFHQLHGVYQLFDLFELPQHLLSLLWDVLRNMPEWVLCRYYYPDLRDLHLRFALPNLFSIHQLPDLHNRLLLLQWDLSNRLSIPRHHSRLHQSSMSKLPDKLLSMHESNK